MSDRFVFVTGANSNYFWLVNAAVESLSEQAPDLDIRVMDFGFTPEQARFFSTQGRLLPRPFEIPANLHPYTLKTCFGLYVRELQVKNFAWFDSDMLCLDPAISSVAALIDEMTATGKKFAACPDMGPNPTLSRFASAFDAPALARFAAERPGNADRRYLNTGFVLFADAHEFLTQWPRLTAKIQGEVCIDQNAFNILFYSNASQGMILNPKRWNAHSALLGETHTKNNQVFCGDERVALLHCTSHQNVFHDELTIGLKVAGSTVPARFKTFREENLRRLHLAALERFLRKNAAGLKASGAV